MNHFSYLKSNIPKYSLQTGLFLLFFAFGINNLSSFSQVPSSFQDTEYQSGFDGVNGITFDASGHDQALINFSTIALDVTGMAINPTNGYLYYASYGGFIREVKYDADNQPPIDKVTSPNSDPFRYDISLTVTDNQSQVNGTSLIVSVNNTPLTINSTMIDDYNVYANTSNETLNLEATVTDLETPMVQLSFKWETSLHHDTHFHSNPIVNQPSSSFLMSPVPCDNEVYFYQVKLTITDAHGLSTVKVKNIPPNCGQNTGDIEPPTTPTNLQLVNVNSSKIAFSWTASTDNVGVTVYEIFRNGVKIDESLNNSYTATNLQPLTFYLFNITAKDTAGNISGQSAGLGLFTNNLVTTDETIYGDALGVNWQNSSTISSLNISNSSGKLINTRSIKVTNPTIDKELILSYGGFPIDTTGYKDGLEFWVYNEGNTIFPLQVQLFSESSGGNGGSNLLVYADANKWTRFLFDKFIFGNLIQIGRISIRLGQSQAQSLYFDEIKLVHCADMYSTQTGNWNQSVIWSCGRNPISTDNITITGGHTVTIPNGVSATLNFLQLLGTLNIQTGGIFDIKNY